jgi:hypothetical protein
VIRKLQTNYFYIQEEIYKTSGAHTREDRFIEVSWGFHGVVVGSRVLWVLRWTMPGMFLGKVAL